MCERCHIAACAASTSLCYFPHVNYNTCLLWLAWVFLYVTNKGVACYRNFYGNKLSCVPSLTWTAYLLNLKICTIYVYELD